MSQLSANSPWFTFTAPSCSGFQVYSFSGTEEVHKPYEYEIELVHESACVDFAELLGQAACLSIADKSGGVRHVHGVIHRFMQLHTSNQRIHYRCLLYGDSFPSGAGQPALRAFTPRVVNEEAAMAAMCTICNQGVHHGWIALSGLPQNILDRLRAGIRGGGAVPRRNGPARCCRGYGPVFVHAGFRNRSGRSPAVPSPPCRVARYAQGRAMNDVLIEYHACRDIQAHVNLF